VDDAILDVENTVRRVRSNRAVGNPRLAVEAVLNASLEVRSAVVFASLMVVLVFLPPAVAFHCTLTLGACNAICRRTRRRVSVPGILTGPEPPLV
jgi:hypothetical protein